MKQLKEKYYVEHYYVKDDGIFPNSKLPILLYKHVLDLPFLFPAHYLKKLFKKNNWTNAWKSGVFEYHHYHSITHEVLGVLKGNATLLLGGENGLELTIQKGDVLIIPAGVAHKNLNGENDIECIGAYPDGKNYDMNYGKPGERPKTDKNIAHVLLPTEDPIFDNKGGLHKYWK